MVVFLSGNSAGAAVAAEGHGADHGQVDIYQHRRNGRIRYFRALGFGANALLYLFLSFWFSVGGLHPLSARWLQEHFAFGPDQGTFDYYGPLNTLALNIGYHNEHHDFHEIPWARLPQLRAMAPEFYDNLGCHRSWVALLVTFIFDPRYSLNTRSENVENAAHAADVAAQPAE